MTNLNADFAAQAKSIFKGNLKQGYSQWKKTNYSYIAPSTTEYTYQWLWDTAFHSIVLTHFDTTWAKSEIKNLLLAQETDGFIPHIIFWGESYNLPHWAYIESKLSLRPRTTAITQPPVLALAIEQIFQKDPDVEFLKEVLPKIAKYHRWLLEHRDPDKDYLISIISPNESGMDELPVFQEIMGYSGDNTAQIHYTYRKADILNQIHRFNSTTILAKDYFNVEELLFNTCFIESSRSLARLFIKIGDKKETEFFKLVAKNSQAALISKCWDEEDQIFYSVYSEKEKKAKVKTIASLIPLFLSDLDKEIVDALVKKHLLNPKEFWTEYPIPSVSKDESYYFPEDTPIHKIKLLWRGPTWINTNWFVIKGLRKYGYNKLADQITEKMVEMIQKEGFREYYNPETGEGYRRKNFAWSTLILDLLY